MWSKRSIFGERSLGPVDWLALTAILAFALVLTDPSGFLSTDVGGKVATLEAMDDRGDVSPDLGYWAEAVDPDGSLYPMWSTVHVNDRWVNVTSLPMLYAMLPLYHVGGALAAGVVPLAGTVAAAAAAAWLAGEIGGRRRATFWMVGAASPLTIYALDLWEHSLGVAAMVAAITLSLRASRGEGSWRPAAVAGLLFGLAATMRQEALVYGFVAGVALIGRLWFLTPRSSLWSRLVRTTPPSGAVALGALATMAANTILEHAMIGGVTRTGRSAGTAAAFGSDLGLRWREAIITGASAFPSSEPLLLVVGIATVALLVAIGRAALNPDAKAAPIGLYTVGLGLIAILLVLDLIVEGGRFIPGLAATTPIAALGLWGAFREPDRAFVASIALGSLPLVWATQYTGGAGPQWGGRYILTTGTVLVAIATAVLVGARARRVLVRVAAVGFAVTFFGVGWTVYRTASIGTAMEQLAAREETVLVFSDSHLSREGGVHAYREKWLAALTDETRQEAADALVALGVDRIGYVQHDRGDVPTVLPGWEVVGTDRVRLIGDDYLLVSTQEPIE